MVRTILSIRVGGVMIGAGGPSKDRQVDVSINAGGMDQWLQQCIIRVRMGNIKGVVLDMRCREFNPGW